MERYRSNAPWNVTHWNGNITHEKALLNMQPCSRKHKKKITKINQKQRTF